MVTDGLTDQIGGPKRLRFGSKHFERMIVENNAKPFDEQRKAFLQTLLEHKGDNDQKDDITLIGFRLSSKNGKISEFTNSAVC
jgi:serine phosphatase RsbU (regulator of sigma subunit)